MSWQPIDTHRPRIDPDSVLIADGRAVGEARWHTDEHGWWWAGNDPTDSWGSQVYPTHWMLLPDPPTTV